MILVDRLRRIVPASDGGEDDLSLSRPSRNGRFLRGARPLTAARGLQIETLRDDHLYSRSVVDPHIVPLSASAPAHRQRWASLDLNASP